MIIMSTSMMGAISFSLRDTLITILREEAHIGLFDEVTITSWPGD